jgi:hypothetical protein
MTNTEARQILIDLNAWRRGGNKHYEINSKNIGLAIDAAIAALGAPDDLSLVYMRGYFDGKRSKSSIAQAIRDAAVNWPQYLGDVECGILDAFSDWCQWQDSMLYGNAAQKTQVRTFMLFVSEALES